MEQEEIVTFSFGENWRDFLTRTDETDIQQAANDIEDWMGQSNVKGKRVIDIGSGSGIHSLIFYKMGAKEIISFDYDPNSVQATTSMWESVGKPNNWKVFQGSVLETDFLEQFGKFDIVYSWGVLHHTGNMWRAIENSSNMVKDNGFYWISLYKKTPQYQSHLRKKQRFNRASILGKKFLLYGDILLWMRERMLKGANPFRLFKKVGRGMNVYNDIVDWLGGLPFEVASKEEIDGYCESQGFSSKRFLPKGYGTGCQVYLYQKSG